MEMQMMKSRGELMIVERLMQQGQEQQEFALAPENWVNI